MANSLFCKVWPTSFLYSVANSHFGTVANILSVQCGQHTFCTVWPTSFLYSVANSHFCKVANILSVQCGQHPFFTVANILSVQVANTLCTVWRTSFLYSVTDRLSSLKTRPSITDTIIRQTLIMQVAYQTFIVRPVLPSDHQTAETST